MTKKILSMLLAGLLLLSFAACGENITPKEDETNQPEISVDDNDTQSDKQPEDNEKSEDNSISFESGLLPTWVKGFYEDLTLENYDSKKDDIPDPIVTFLDTKEQYEALLDPETVAVIQAQTPQDRTPAAQKACETMDRYTDEYLAQKQIIAVSRLKTGAEEREFVVKELVLQEDGNYLLTVEQTRLGGPAIEGLYVDTVTVEVDRSLGITPENLTVEVIDKTK